MKKVLRCALATVLVVAAGSCAVGPQPQARTAEKATVPFGLLDPDAPPLVPSTVPDPGGEEIQLCFVRESRLVAVAVRLEPPVSAARAVMSLLSPPADAPATIRTALANPSTVKTVTVSGGVAHVDLATSITQLGGGDQLLAIGQIVCTLTARPGVGQVLFSVEGAPAEVPRGDGSLVAQPVSRDDYAGLLVE